MSFSRFSGAMSHSGRRSPPTSMGIDPGIATVGFGVIDSEKNRLKLVSTGVIETPAHTSLSSRLDRIYDDTQELISTFSPDVVSVEELFFKKNITTGISVAHGRGVLLLACYKAGVQIFEYTPMQVKQAVVGYGLAEKKQVIYMTLSGRTGMAARHNRKNIGSSFLSA